MISIKELEEKRNYLTTLRSFTEEEQEYLRKEFIIGNTRTLEVAEKAYTREQKLLCITDEWSEKEAIKANEILSYFWELVGIMRVHEYINNVLEEEATGNYEWILSEDILKWVNRIILDQYYYLSPLEKGFYREYGKASLGMNPLPEYSVFRPRLIALLDWYGKTESDLISKLAAFHLSFEVDVHPFYDGNGRTGRAIMNLELARKGFPLINLKYNDFQKYDYSFNEYRESNKMDTMQDLIGQELNKELDNQIMVKEKKLVISKTNSN